MTEVGSSNSAETAGSGTRPQKRRQSALPRKASTKKQTKNVAAAGGGFGGTLMLLIAHQMPAHSPWAALMMWASPAFAALTGAAMPLLREQGARWGVQYTVWRSEKKLVKLSKRQDVSEESRAEAREFLEEIHTRKARAEISRVREVLADE